MSLDGLRAWIGEVERKLGARTRVFLVLVAIAIGGAGAGVYLAIDAKDNSVSKADVQAVREELEGRIGAGGGTTDLTQIEAELRALQVEVAQLKDAGGTEKKGSSTGATDGGGAETANPNDANGKLQELAEEAEVQAGK